MGGKIVPINLLRRFLMPVAVSAALVLAGTSPTTVEAISHVRVPMRDGIHLDTNVFHPAGSGRFPTILIRTPYGKGDDLQQGYLTFVNHGYTVVFQDVRGRYRSEGTFDPMDQEGADGYDTLTWITRQPWSNGKVAMAGGSYLGIAQWKLAVLNHPALKALFPVVSGSDDYLDRFYSVGGGMKLGHRLMWLAENMRVPGTREAEFRNYVWHLPLRTSDVAATGRWLPVYQKVINHPDYDSYWKTLSVKDKLDRVHVPVFSVAGWYDNYVESDLAAFSALSKTEPRGSEMYRIVVGPWPHNMSIKFPGIDFGPDSSAPIRAYQLEWFDRWLKGSAEPAHRTVTAWRDPGAKMDFSPVEIFVMGVNRWRDEAEWPLARTRYTPVYLNSKGKANGLRGDGELTWSTPRKDKVDTYVDDPRNPVPTMGGAVCCNPKLFPWGPMDQRTVESRQDVLVYSTEPMTRELEVTGPVRLLLWVSTNAPDTDFMAKLVDVFPNGEARNLTDGMLRLRYREGLDKEKLSKAGDVYPITIDLGVTSNVFLPGHRIRLEVASTNFPRFDRNPNTGRRIADEASLKKAEEKVMHGRKYPSHLLLPVIPEAPASRGLQSSASARYSKR